MTKVHWLKLEYPVGSVRTGTKLLSLFSLIARADIGKGKTERRISKIPIKANPPKEISLSSGSSFQDVGRAVTSD